ncbi:integrase core domain-containing protein [Streptosporangium roseum]|uniref:integrase core domain-containing protein n=1 Tax=Streptosporangium roseum TaxID=2001 RepID=UPI0001A3993F|nr:integrase core domain-containing protein [Streptosporangium roseum]
MGRDGCALDNAPAESFNATLKVELTHRYRSPVSLRPRAEARLKIATWIAGFYNTHRRHSSADGLPPIICEQRITAVRAAIRVRLQQPIAA